MEEDNIKLSIINGSNINKEVVREIRSPFYVGEKSRNKKMSGTGMGLPIVKAIMNNHNFNIIAEVIKSEIIFTVTFLTQ